jgi:hypothetical protein
MLVIREVATITAMILHPHPPGWAVILQSSHAMLAFQLADHWGNRGTLRPGPRPEVLAAVLLHDAGWDGREEPLRSGPDGVPLAFDSWPEAEREALWHAAVERAALRGRYVAYLVSHHVASLARRSARAQHAEFVAAEEQRQHELRADLARDPRYGQTFATGGDDVNRAIVRLADAIAVQLSVGVTEPVELAGLPTVTGPAALAVRPLGDRTYRLRPWPLMGRRLTVHADVRLLAEPSFASDAELRRAWESAPVQRISWTLLATGEPADKPADKRAD